MPSARIQESVKVSHLGKPETNFTPSVFLLHANKLYKTEPKLLKQLTLRERCFFHGVGYHSAFRYIISPLETPIFLVK